MIFTTGSQARDLLLYLGVRRAEGGNVVKTLAGTS